MKKLNLKKISLSLLAAICGFAMSANAQTNNVWHDDFDQFPIGANSTDGTYGSVPFNFSGAGYGNPVVVITNDMPDTLSTDASYTHTNNCAFIFDTNPSDFPNALNFGVAINRIQTLGNNTNKSLRAYTLNFDVAVQDSDIGGIGGFVGPSIGMYGGNSG